MRVVLAGNVDHQIDLVAVDRLDFCAMFTRRMTCGGHFNEEGNAFYSGVTEEMLRERFNDQLDGVAD